MAAKKAKPAKGRKTKATAKRNAKAGKKPRCLVVFFSRSGTTKKLAEAVSIVMRCDIDEIHEQSPRTGILGFLRSGREAAREQIVAIESLKNPAEYDIVIAGTPVWAGNLSSPVRSYLHNHRNSIKKAAFFCTCGSDEGKAFQSMQKALGKKPLATLCLKSTEVYKGGYVQKLSEFMDRILGA